MTDLLGDKKAIILRGHGLTAVGHSLPAAVMTALNVNRLAAMTCAIARMGMTAPAVPAADRAELVDLGSSFHDEATWRSYVAKLRPAGLALGTAE